MEIPSPIGNGFPAPSVNSPAACSVFWSGSLLVLLERLGFVALSPVGVSYPNADLGDAHPLELLTELPECS